MQDHDRSLEVPYHQYQGLLEVVDSNKALLGLLNTLPDLSGSSPCLYFGLERTCLDPIGLISILSLLIPSTNKIVLVDVHSLGKNAFSTSTDKGLSLKSVLESGSMRKGVFDIRDTANALFYQFEIRVQGIVDIQLMEWVARKKPKDEVFGILTCVYFHGSLDYRAQEHWFRTRQHSEHLSEINVRPIRPDIQDYCVANIRILPVLYSFYNNTLRLERKGKRTLDLSTRLDQLASTRISNSCHANYNRATGCKSRDRVDLDQLRAENLDCNTGDRFMDACMRLATFATRFTSN